MYDTGRAILYIFLDCFRLIYEGKELAVYIENSKPTIKPTTNEIMGLAYHEYKYPMIDTMQGCPRGRPCTHNLYRTCLLSRSRCAAGQHHYIHSGRGIESRRRVQEQAPPNAEATNL